jgi:hypothetical protein
MTEHTYPPSFGPQHENPFVRMSWELLDAMPPGLLPEEWRFMLAGEVAGALQEAYTVGHEGRSGDDMAKTREGRCQEKTPQNQ